MSKNSDNKIIKILITAFIIFFTFMAGYEYMRYGSIFHNSEHFRKVYKEALVQKNNENYSQAITTLGKISPRYEAYDAVLFQQAQCATKAGDEATVQKKLKSLINKYPQSHIYIQAKYDLAKSYLRSGDKKQAGDTFQNIVNNHPNTKYETGSYYYLADLNIDKNKLLSTKYWKKYIYQSQDGRFSVDCANNIIKSKIALSKEDNYYLGLVYYDAQNYDKALTYLKAAPLNNTWYYIAKTYISKKSYPQAKAYIKTGLAQYTTGFSQKDLADIMYSYENISSNKLTAWNELSEMTKSKANLEDLALYNKANFLQQDKSVELYKHIVNTHIKGDYASEALKKLFWNEYKAKNYTQAKEYAKKHIANFSNTKSAPEMHYWLGKLYEKENNKTEARKIYNKILSKYPDDYYAMRAYGRIAYITKGKDYGWDISPHGEIKQNNFKLDLPYNYSEIKNKFGATLAELLMAEDFETIEYFDEFKEPFIESWILYKKGLRSTSTTTARNAVDDMTDKPIRTDYKWHFVYPCYFAKSIDKYALNNRISPYLLIALIREESYFNPLALSQSNAIGLTQILPSTAREVSQRKGYGKINEFLLLNPETNVKYGAAYFAQIKKQLNENNVYAVASYNGGAASVRSWLKRSNSRDIDEFIEFIPYSETQNYVKKVFRSYWNYVRIYGG